MKKSVTNRITLRIQNDLLEALKNESEKKDLTLNAMVNKILVKNVAYDENVNVVETMIIPHDLFHIMIEKMKNSELIEIATEGPRIVKKIFDIMGVSYDIDHTIANYFIVLDKYCNWFEFSHKIIGSKYRLIFCTGSNNQWSGFIQNYIRSILESLKIIVSSESNSDGIIIFEFTHRNY
ncbi:MAG TPA: hypothetical protein VFP45_04130 [Candidatus Nitrosotalea sp.]|nr:hypothetical protein [Candidatus Nitrosotalea sp.]